MLIPAWVGDAVAASALLPPATLSRIHGLDWFLAEHAKSARAFLKSCGHPTPLQQLRIDEYTDQSPAPLISQWLDDIAAGLSAGVISEAGAPGVADPGARIVRAAHLRGISVVPQVGPSAILLAIMAAGMNGQRFAFHGYLPVEQAARVERIRALERDSATTNTTQVFIETPYRNDALLADLKATLSPATDLAVAVNVTQPDALIRTQTVRDWRDSNVVIGKRPATFLLLAAQRTRASR